MADFVNTTTTELLASVSDMPAPWVSITRENLDAWSVIPQKYRKWITDHIEEMDAGEKAVVDAALLEADRDAVMQAVDNVEDVLRAVVLVIRDELNAHADKINAILDAIDAGTNLTTVKSNIAAISDYPQRTIAQLRTSVRGKLGS